MKWTEARRCWQSFWMYTQGGNDLIPGWKLKELAESALATGGSKGSALSASMRETVTPWEFSVEGESGSEADEHG
jgi:hypothetical protein